MENLVNDDLDLSLMIVLIIITIIIIIIIIIIILLLIIIIIVIIIIIIVLIIIVIIIIILIIIKALCVAKLGQTFKVFINIKTLSYLLKINKRTNKKYLCNSEFEMHLYCHIYIYERCFLASR